MLVTDSMFVRFIAECDVCGIFNDEIRLEQVADEMNVTLDEIYAIIDSAREKLGLNS